MGGNQIINEVFYNSHHLWLHHCCWQDHRNAAISNWNFYFFWFKSVWLKAKFFEVSHSFWFRARFAGRHFAKWDDQKIELDFMLIAWWWSLSLHDLMKFSYLIVRKIRFIMAGNRKYRQNLWSILDTLSQ